MAITPEQIEQLAFHPGIRPIAVVNFLSSLDGLTKPEAIGNLDLDASLYGWNAETRCAIRQGIELHFARGAR